MKKKTSVKKKKAAQKARSLTLAQLKKLAGGSYRPPPCTQEWPFGHTMQKISGEPGG